MLPGAAVEVRRDAILVEEELWSFRAVSDRRVVADGAFKLLRIRAGDVRPDSAVDRGSRRGRPGRRRS